MEGGGVGVVGGVAVGAAVVFEVGVEEFEQGGGVGFGQAAAEEDRSVAVGGEDQRPPAAGAVGAGLEPGESLLGVRRGGGADLGEDVVGEAGEFVGGGGAGGVQQQGFGVGALLGGEGGGQVGQNWSVPEKMEA